jgi:hypothetical protein
MDGRARARVGRDRTGRGLWRRALLVAAMLSSLVSVAGVGLSAGPAAAASCSLCAGGEFFPVTPTRVFDTRNGTGGRNVPLPFGQSADIVVTGGSTGVPATGVLAVALNVTVDQPSAPGYLTVYPAGAGAPLASNLNFTPGNPVANFVVVGVGAGGEVSVTPGPATPNAQTAVIVDVVGYYATSAVTTHGARLRPLTPARVLDTRNGTGGVKGPLGDNGAFDLKLRGVGGVPDDPSVTAVILNLTGTEAARTTFVQATPAGSAAAGSTSSLNLLPGQNKANLAMVPLNAAGLAHFYNLFGPMQLVADVVGYYAKVSSSDESRAGRVVPLSSPFRAIETRAAGGGDGVKLGPSQQDTWDFGPFVGSLRDTNGAPVGNVSGLVMNLTATELGFPYTTANRLDYMTVYPSDAGGVPLASSLNFGEGDNMPNLAVAPLSADGKLGVYNFNGFTHYLGDVSAVVLAN